jgi:hypothetical protein
MTYLKSHQNSYRGENNDENCKECQVIYFSRGSNYTSYLQKAVIDLINYSKRYFYNWEAVALAQFTSCSQVQDLNDDFLPVFFQWYVINYRFHNDTLIDIYLSEYGEKLDEQMKAVFAALGNSYVSLYRVLWIKNNAIAVSDVFNSTEFIIEKGFNSDLTENILFLGRMVIMDNQTMIMGPLVLPEDQKDYILDNILFSNMFKGMDFSEHFIREHAEVICGLVLDLCHEIKKIPVRVLSLSLEKLNYKKILDLIHQNREFSIIEKNRWVKFKKETSQRLFTRIYFNPEVLVAVAEDSTELISLQQNINEIVRNVHGVYDLDWTEGLGLFNQKKAEEIFFEIINDKNIEEWLISPNSNLEGLTPLEAINETAGIVLLDKLLIDMERQESRAILRGEYFFPVSVIRRSLDWDNDEIQKVLQSNRAVALKVEKYRYQLDLSYYVIGYKWINEQCKRVAINAFDLYYSDVTQKEQLALLLYMWNEYSSIYNPQIHDSKVWLAALEHILLLNMKRKTNYWWIAKKHGVSFNQVRKNAKLLMKHFSTYPLDFELKLKTYPQCQELTYTDKIYFYEELQSYIEEYAFLIDGSSRKVFHEARKEFYQNINTSAKFWIGKTSKIYNEFFNEYYLFDRFDNMNSTITNKFWEDHARRFPPYLKALTFNIMMSYVGAYNICSCGVNDFIFEDIFNGKRTEVYIKPGSLSDKLVPGTIIITRLIPLAMKKWWVSDPMFIFLPDMKELFENTLNILMEYNAYDISDIRYLKLRGMNSIMAYCIALDELEQNTRNLMDQPLCLNWRFTVIENRKNAIKLLKNSKNFRIIKENDNLSCFLWINQNPDSTYQWGYIRIEGNQLLITTPPGKDIDKLASDIRRAFRSTNMITAFTQYKAEVSVFKELEYYFIIDLADFYNNDNSDLVLSLLRQDATLDNESEWLQGIFFIKFSSLLMNCLSGSQ